MHDPYANWTPEVGRLEEENRKLYRQLKYKPPVEEQREMWEQAFTAATTNSMIASIREIINEIPDEIERSRIKNEWSARMRQKFKAVEWYSL